MNSKPTRPSFRSIAITQAIAVVGFIIVPLAVTAIAPCTKLTLTTVGDHVAANVTMYLLLFIPAWSERIEPLTEVEAIVIAADYHITAEDRRRGRTGHQVADGSVLLTGPTNDYQIQSTVAATPGQALAIEEFIETMPSEPQTMHFSAGFWLSYVLGGAMTAWAGLYVTGVVLAIGRGIIRMAQGKHPVPDQTEASTESSSAT